MGVCVCVCVMNLIVPLIGIVIRRCALALPSDTRVREGPLTANQYMTPL